MKNKIGVVAQLYLNTEGTTGILCPGPLSSQDGSCVVGVFQQRMDMADPRWQVFIWRGEGAVPAPNAQQSDEVPSEFCKGTNSSNCLPG